MYTNLKSYQNALIVHDFTVEFVKRYVDRSNRSDMSYKSYSRMADQMIQAARSGKQNIVEGSSASKEKPKNEPFLLGVASASLKELLEDYQDYLRQRGLMQWDKNDPRALRVRGLYRSDRTDKSDRSDRADTTDTTDTIYKSYQSYLSNAEDACNAMICLINQTTYLLDNQIRAVGRQLNEKGISLESHNQKLKRILVKE